VDQQTQNNSTDSKPPNPLEKLSKEALVDLFTRYIEKDFFLAKERKEKVCGYRDEVAAVGQWVLEKRKRLIYCEERIKRIGLIADDLRKPCDAHFASTRSGDASMSEMRKCEEQMEELEKLVRKR
jgi:hypothetical protein